MPTAPETSLARLLDDVRPLIAQARERGERPRFIMLSPRDFDAVAECKGSDRKRHMPMLILGMEIVRSDDRDQAPRVF
jgi:hypothetical protein